jgi:hypothetical protein
MKPSCKKCLKPMEKQGIDEQNQVVYTCPEHGGFETKKANWLEMWREKEPLTEFESSLVKEKEEE